MNYPELKLYINGEWREGSEGLGEFVIDPATEKKIGFLPYASKKDLDEALDSSLIGFHLWRKKSALERGEILKKVAKIIRERSQHMAEILSFEQGKTVSEALIELDYTADVFSYYGEEGQRTYGRIIPARSNDVRQLVVKRPIGPSLGLSPWNFPGIVPARKIGAALAAGCSSILKAAEETPATAMLIVKACEEAGVPAGVVNLVFGEPSEVSSYLINSDIIRKISFTGSIPVGKHLARLAAERLQRCTLELGGHAPVIVMDDIDAERAAQIAATGKFYRNAGQVCVSPTRFFVHEKVYKKFVDTMVQIANSVRVGNGRDPQTQMGPLANKRRIEAMEQITFDVRRVGGKVAAGGHRLGDKGFFWAPTVITEIGFDAAVMNEEPFGPIAPIVPFTYLEEALEEANRLPQALAAYAFTDSMHNALAITEGLDAGVIAVNHVVASLPETPFGGIKESGDGREGGSEGLEAFLVTKLISESLFS